MARDEDMADIACIADYSHSEHLHSEAFFVSNKHCEFTAPPQKTPFDNPNRLAVHHDSTQPHMSVYTPPLVGEPKQKITNNKPKNTMNNEQEEPISGRFHFFRYKDGTPFFGLEASTKKNQKKKMPNFEKLIQELSLRPVLEKIIQDAKEQKR